MAANTQTRSSRFGVFPVSRSHYPGYLQKNFLWLLNDLLLLRSLREHFVEHLYPCNRPCSPLPRVLPRAIPLFILLFLDCISKSKWFSSPKLLTDLLMNSVFMSISVSRRHKTGVCSRICS